MKFFKIAVYVLFALSFANLAGSLYMYNGIMNKTHSINVSLPVGVTKMPEDCKLRDSQIFQAILMTHHRIGIHEPGDTEFCPTCQSAMKIANEQKFIKGI